MAVTEIVRPPAGADVPTRDSTSPPIVRLEEVIKVYREVDVETIALRGVDLSVAAGEFVAIMGRSGSGKSTLLNLLSGSDRPTAGRVTVAGVSMDRGAESERAGLRGKTVGIVFQTQNLVTFLTLEENVRLAGDLAERPLDADAANTLLTRVGLKDRASHRPEQLSGGEQQRAALACVLAGRPKLLLADEITGELDSATADDLLAVVRDLHKTEQMTVILVTHDPRVADTADRIIELRDGRVFADRKPA